MRVLPYIGFNRLRPGRIHLFCGRCGQKISNAERGEMDPPKAVLLRTGCPDCSSGDKEGESIYRDAEGRLLCSYCGEWRCEHAEGTRDCDERLIKAFVKTWG